MGFLWRRPLRKGRPVGTAYWGPYLRNPTWPQASRRSTAGPLRRYPFWKRMPASAPFEKC
eukprot:369904-Prorocentrum_lima.AAC.1